MDQRICSVADCDRKHYGKGFCHKHYQRWRTHGDPDLGAAVRNEVVCMAPECTKAAHARNLCPMHYQRLRTRGSLNPEPLPPKERPKVIGVLPCSIDGCDRLVKARGWCSAHYSRWLRHGDPQARLRGEVVDGKRICSLCQVDKPLDAFWRTAESWCRDCFNDRQRKRARERYVPKPKAPATCDHCGQAFMSNKRRSIFCSTECAEVGKHRRNIKHTQARRARLRDVSVEPFLPSEVYERDGWLCGLCGGAIDRDAVKPHPLSRSIDHIVPISLGGEHSLRNVQAAHLGCNVRKGARAIV